MQTHLRDDADGSELAIGTQLDPLHLRCHDILSSGYLLVSEPVPGEGIRLLETWDCPSCGHADNWALITISGAEISGIEVVLLDRTTLNGANFISEVQADLMAEAPHAARSSPRKSSVDVLRRILS